MEQELGGWVGEDRQGIAFPLPSLLLTHTGLFPGKNGACFLQI